MNVLFRRYSDPNLRRPIAGCLERQKRSIIFEGDLRFKDGSKEARDSFNFLNYYIYNYALYWRIRIFIKLHFIRLICFANAIC